MCQKYIQALVLQTGRSDCKVNEGDSRAKVRCELRMGVPRYHDQVKVVREIDILITDSDEDPPTCLVKFLVEN